MSDIISVLIPCPTQEVMALNYHMILYVPTRMQIKQNPGQKRLSYHAKVDLRVAKDHSCL